MFDFGPGGHTAEQAFEHYYENAPCGYLTLLADGTILRCNQTLLRWLGRQKSGLVGTRFQAILTPGARIFWEMQCAPILKLDGRLEQVAIDLACADGMRLPTLIDWQSVNGQDGAFLCYRCMVVNATERRAYEIELLAERERARGAAEAVSKLNAELEERVKAGAAELLHMQKIESLGQLTGGIAHDFNNLLTPIIVGLDLVQRRAKLEPRDLRLIGGALEAAERAKTLVQRLLAFARRQHLDARPVDIKELIDGMLDLVQHSLGSSIVMTTAFEGGLPDAMVDPGQLELALLNLCVNASDAMPDGGTLTIGAKVAAIKESDSTRLTPGRYMRIDVADTGVGMDAETLKRAAEPFFSTKEIGKGTGLGLSMVFGLAEQSGGALVIESKPGRGTAASLYLPLAPLAAARAAKPAMHPPLAAAEPLTIVLVDDDDNVRESVAGMLRDAGHTILEAPAGPPALDLLRAARPDLMITDFAMPGMSGAELAIAARRLYAGLPVLLITGYANILHKPADGLLRLSKPFREEELALAIQTAIAEQE